MLQRRVHVLPVSRRVDEHHQRNRGAAERVQGDEAGGRGGRTDGAGHGRESYIPQTGRAHGRACRGRGALRTALESVIEWPRSLHVHSLRAARAVMASVWEALRRLTLGVVLIALASAFLLYTDRDRRASGAPGTHRTWQVSFIQYSQTADVEECEQGVRDGLRGSGLAEGRDYTISVRNAQGDMATVSAL